MSLYSTRRLRHRASKKGQIIQSDSSGQVPFGFSLSNYAFQNVSEHEKVSEDASSLPARTVLRRRGSRETEPLLRGVEREQTAGRDLDIRNHRKGALRAEGDDRPISPTRPQMV